MPAPDRLKIHHKVGLHGGFMRVKWATGVPLYVQVRQKLLEELSNMEPGEAIPTEAELEKRFAVSRITIRKAIEGLVSDGLLARRQGRGTFVQRSKLTHELDAITSWTEQLRALGYTPHTRDRAAEEILPPKRIAHLLKLVEGEQVIKLRRLRLANQEPITLMFNYLPSRLVPGFVEIPFTSESLYELLQQRYGLVAATATDTVETREASEDEAALLKIQPWSPVLCVTRLSFLDDGAPLEVAVAISRGDRYQYRVSLRGRIRLESSRSAPASLSSNGGGPS